MLSPSLPDGPSSVEALLKGPAMKAPPGVKYNFDTHDNLSKYIIPTDAVILTLATIILILRIYTKRFITRSMAWDDYTAILGWALFVGLLIPGIYSIPYGGRHQWDTSLRDSFKLLYYANVIQIIYGPALFVIKLSILLQYMRLFVPRKASNMTMYVMIHSVIWTLFVFYTMDAFFEIFPCNPRELAWNKLIDHGTCLDTEGLIIAAATVNVVSDIVILFLPIFSIWKLQMETKQKLQLTMVFGFGLLAIFASVMRLVHSVILYRTEDKTRAFVPTGLWAIAETGIGFMCSCFPVLPKFFQVMIPKLSGNRSNITALSGLPTYNNASRTHKSNGSTLIKDPYDSRSNLADGYMDSLELTNGVGNRNVDIRAGIRRQSEPDAEQGQIIKTVRIEIQRND